MTSFARCAIRSLFALLFFGCVFPLAAQTDQKFYVSEETDIRFGFPGDPQGDRGPDGRAVPMYKANHWTPVWVTIRAGKDGISSGELTVWARDCDQVNTKYSVPLSSFQPGETRTILAYTKLAGNNDPVDITIQADRVTKNLQGKPAGLDANHWVILAIGNRLPGLASAIKPPEGQQQNQGKIESIGVVTNVPDLPRHWFGYDAVNAIVLTSGNRAFISEFNQPEDRDRRKRALVEWVRRGGHLVLCAGQNQDVIAQTPELKPLLPATLKGSVALKIVRLKFDRDNTGPGRERPERRGVMPRRDEVEEPLIQIAKIENDLPEKYSRVLMKDGENILAIQASYGAGCVTLLAWDPDMVPFQTWADDRDFWKGFVEHTMHHRLGQMQQAGNPQGWPPGRGYYPDGNTTDLLQDMQTHLENFEDVPVISFGWVALFIFLYILIVGPIDYFLLKYLFKRLELTWITFPAVVLTISAGAYFLAYWIKGEDLKVNKVDVVDIDLHGGQMYGTTWFTIFSPRIQHSDIGIEPVWGASRIDVKITDKTQTSGAVAKPEAGCGVAVILEKKARNEAARMTLSGVDKELPVDVQGVKADLIGRVILVSDDGKTMSIEIAGWTRPPDVATADNLHQASLLTAWLGRADDNEYGRRSHSLFQRQYGFENHYNDPSAGDLLGTPTSLDGVAIQVWSTKSFTASYQAPLNSSRPQIDANLYHKKDVRPELRHQVYGTITNNLPVDLEDVVLFYRNRTYTLRTLAKGQTRKIDDTVNLGSGGGDIPSWFQSSARPSSPGYYGPRYQQNYSTTLPADYIIKPMFFTELHGGRPTVRNSTFRPLDQSWRVSELQAEEVVLYGKVARKEGKSQAIAAAGETPTILWLGHAPQSGVTRPALEGKTRQETYVRVFIPVRPER